MSNRRDFGKMALGGAFGALLAASRSARATAHPSAPGIKLCAQVGPTPTDEQLLFLKQIGAEYVSVGSTPELRTAEPAGATGRPRKVRTSSGSRSSMRIAAPSGVAGSIVDVGAAT